MPHTDGFLIPVLKTNKDAYRAAAEFAAPIFLEHGATRIVETWGDDIKNGHTTDFNRAVIAKTSETVVFSWIEWPSKEAHDAGNAKIMADERLANAPMPFDGKRLIFGGFVSLVDTANPATPQAQDTP